MVTVIVLVGPGKTLAHPLIGARILCQRKGIQIGVVYIDRVRLHYNQRDHTGTRVNRHVIIGGCYLKTYLSFRHRRLGQITEYPVPGNSIAVIRIAIVVHLLIRQPPYRCQIDLHVNVSRNIIMIQNKNTQHRCGNVVVGQGTRLGLGIYHLGPHKGLPVIRNIIMTCITYPVGPKLTQSRRPRTGRILHIIHQSSQTLIH